MKEKKSTRASSDSQPWTALGHERTREGGREGCSRYLDDQTWFKIVMNWFLSDTATYDCNKIREREKEKEKKGRIFR
jgi:hypothetical protein